MNLQLLPHSCKKLGLLLFVFGNIPGAISGFVSGYNDAAVNSNEFIEPFMVLPEKTMWILDIVSILGITIYALSKKKIFDELFQRLRLEALQLTFFLTVVGVLIGYMITKNYHMRPSYLISIQLLAFLIIYYIKKQSITSSN